MEEFKLKMNDDDIKMMKATDNIMKKFTYCVTKDKFLEMENAVQERVHISKFKRMESKVEGFIKLEDFNKYKEKMEQESAALL